MIKAARGVALLMTVVSEQRPKYSLELSMKLLGYGRPRGGYTKTCRDVDPLKLSIVKVLFALWRYNGLTNCFSHSTLRTFSQSRGFVLP
jgi:hypothetical protein